MSTTRFDVFQVALFILPSISSINIGPLCVLLYFSIDRQIIIVFSFFLLSYTISGSQTDLQLNNQADHANEKFLYSQVVKRVYYLNIRTRTIVEYRFSSNEHKKIKLSISRYIDTIHGLIYKSLINARRKRHTGRIERTLCIRTTPREFKLSS